MRSRLGTKTVPKLVFAFVLIAMMVSAAYAPSVPYTLLWSDPVDTFAIALSENGQYVASIAGGQVRFYDRSSSTPLWTTATPSQENWESVAISADGNSVAAGGNNYVYFWANAKSLTGNPPATWTSTHLGLIKPRCIAISDDGDYLVAGGTGLNVFYWAGARSKSGSSVATSWSYELPGLVEAVDISSDGDYVVAGFGTDVAYWKGARTSTGSQVPAWVSTEPNDAVVDVAVSDDGNYVAAAGGTDTVYYWAGAKTLTGNPTSLTTWYGGIGVSFTSVDMSSDGNSVIAGASSGVYFWGGARGLTGKPQNPSWTYATTSTVHDVAINAAGDYMAAANDVVTSIAYFFDNEGALKWSYLLDNPVSYISMSSDGATLAVGTGLSGTAYLFDTGFPIHVVSAPVGGAPVGGFIEPVNKLTVFAPYLALFGLVATVAVVVVKPWKKTRN